RILGSSRELHIRTNTNPALLHTVKKISRSGSHITSSKRQRVHLVHRQPVRHRRRRAMSINNQPRISVPRIKFRQPWTNPLRPLPLIDQLNHRHPINKGSSNNRGMLTVNTHSGTECHPRISRNRVLRLATLPSIKRDNLLTGLSPTV